ncbi:MAG: outer membrane beta-barrel protein, partial [Planctomycetaceae bacterium]|nr:outer membrane beta-barrel protein [Planctomycetaceae bacterium]
SKKRSAFADKHLPNPAKVIRQVAAETPADSIWDNPQMYANSGQPAAVESFAGAPVAGTPTGAPYPPQYTAQTPPPAANYPYNAFQNQYAANPYGSVNPYAPVNPFANPYAANNMSGSPDPYTSMYYPQPQEQDPNIVYQTLLVQELARRQAEEMKAEGGAANGSGKPEEENENGAKSAAESWTSSKLMPVKVTSPLWETCLSAWKTMGLFNSPTGPDRGCGHPLVNKSWLDHPYSFGGFIGPLIGSKITDNIKQKNGSNGGMIFGYNMNDYWGLESRIYFSSLEFHNAAGADWVNQLAAIDASVNYYPLGNAKWRPFLKYGFGAGRETLSLVNGGGTAGGKFSDTVVTMPTGIGMRYWWNDRLAVQSDIICNTIFASGIAKSQSHWSFGLGLTYSFGSNQKKRPVQYWPAVPSMGSKW